LWKESGESKREAGDSHYNVGIMYRDGVGYERNYGYAAHWLRLAADKGYVQAMYALGELAYYGGPNYPKNFNAALYWWQKGIDKGDAGSLLQVAGLYIRGKELPRDLFTAQDYINIAKQSNHPEVKLYWQLLQDAFKEYDVNGSRWIKELRQDIFTIEYYSSSSFASARRFAIKNEIDRPAIYQTVYGDYVLIGGLYEKIEDAYKTIYQLPKALSELRPRPRATSIIQAELVPPSVYLPQTWIRERASNDFTAHLFIAESSIEVLDFVDLFGLSNAAVYADKDGYFGIVAGVFESEQEALSAIALLPDSLKNFQPQPIRFINIQNRLVDGSVLAPEPISKEDQTFFKGFGIASSKEQLMKDQLMMGQLMMANLEGEFLVDLSDQQLFSIPLDQIPKDLEIESVTLGHVIDFLSSWEQSWEQANIEKYIAKYTDNYQKTSNTSHRQWEANLRKSIHPDRNTQIEISDLKVSFDASKKIVKATFHQKYSVVGYKDQTNKELKIVLTDGQLKIIAENKLG